MATKRAPKELAVHTTSLQMETRKEQLPPGCCGVVQGVALTYNTVDSYGTMFQPGCLDRTRSQKIAAGKVLLFGDHGHSTDTHIGTVVAMDDVGDSVVMTAHLFDTEDGQKMRDYLAACMTTKSFTGLSVGVYPRQTDWLQKDGKSVLAYSEVELAEVSVTPMPAVEGAQVTGLRNRNSTRTLARALKGILMAMDPEEAAAVFHEIIPPQKPDTEVTPLDAVVPVDGLATMESRMRALRSTYATRS